MPKKKNKKLSKAKTKEVKGQLGKKKETAREKMIGQSIGCLLYTSPSPRDGLLSRMPSSA